MSENKKKMTLSAALNNVSESDTSRECIEYIKLSLIDKDPNNFYQLSGVDKLADNIATCGLQQPIRVRKHPSEDGRYMIVSGHRRREAVAILAKEDPDRWDEVACIVERDEVSPALQQLRLIYANANSRSMTSAELGEQAAQVEKLLYQLKEEGYEFPGRMRDHVAEAVNASKTKLARLKMIRDNLASCWKPEYKKNNLSESTAYELSKLTEADQRLIFNAKQETGANIRWLYADDIKTYAKRLDAIDKLKCKEAGNVPCRNYEQKRKETIKKERYFTSPCDKCCSVCDRLVSCKNACPHLAEQIRKIRADKKEANRQAKMAQEEKDRPTIEKLQQLWKRFGEARQRAGKTVKEAYNAAGMYYAKGDDEKTVSMESLSANFTALTTLPYGYSCRLPDVSKYINIADLFGCSVDYLLCRTDEPQSIMSCPDDPDANRLPLQWISGQEKPHKKLTAAAKFAATETGSPITTIVQWDGQRWCFKTGASVDAKCVAWFPLPPEE